MYQPWKWFKTMFNTSEKCKVQPHPDLCEKPLIMSMNVNDNLCVIMHYLYLEWIETHVPLLTWSSGHITKLWHSPIAIVMLDDPQVADVPGGNRTYTIRLVYARTRDSRHIFSDACSHWKLLWLAHCVPKTPTVFKQISSVLVNMCIHIYICIYIYT